MARSILGLVTRGQKDDERTDVHISWIERAGVSGDRTVLACRFSGETIAWPENVEAGATTFCGGEVMTNPGRVPWVRRGDFKRYRYELGGWYGKKAGCGSGSRARLQLGAERRWCSVVSSWKNGALAWLKGFMRQGAVWIEPGDIPPDVLRELDAMCVEATGSGVTEVELRELLSGST